MRIILVGALGDVGRAAHEALGQRHDIITVGRTSGDYRVDMTNMDSVKDLYSDIGEIDAVISCAGDAAFQPLDAFTQDAFMAGLQQKVMGQINLVLAGLNVVADGGSFTLTSGILNRDPIRMGTNAATANGALAGFVKSASIEMPRGLRINVVSPGLLEVSEPRFGKWFPGHKPVTSLDVGRAYVKSVEGAITGEVILVE